MLEVLDRAGISLLCVLDEPLPTLQEELIGLNVLRRLSAHAHLLIKRELRLERDGNAQRNVGLDGENVRQLPVVRLHPQMLVIFDVDELCDDPHVVTRAPHAAIQEDRGPQRRSDLLQAPLSLLKRHYRRT